jgi:cytochrome bd-type quinol oxidase subunit 2
MPDTPAPIQRDARLKKKSFIVLLVTTLIFGVLTLPGIGAVMVSPKAFDTSESPANPKLIALMVSLISFPVVAFISIIASWVLYFKSRYRAAIWMSLLPLLPLIAGLLAFILVETFPE